MRGRPTYEDDRRSKMGDLADPRPSASVGDRLGHRADRVSTRSPDRPRVRLLLRAQASVCAALGGARHGSNQFVLMLSWPGGARGPEWSPT